MKIKVLVLEHLHADEYRNLRLQALNDHPEAFASSFEEEKENSVEFYRNRIASQQSRYFGAFDNRKLVGVVTIVKENKKKLQHRANIYAMYVSPKYRGCGVGRKLMEQAINQAAEWKGIEQIYLTVVTTNESAKKLYKSLKFETYGIEKKALKINNNYYDEEHMVFYL